MKILSDKIITPINKPDIIKGRINRKLIQNIFFIEIDRPQKLNGFTPFMFYEISKAFTETDLRWSLSSFSALTMVFSISQSVLSRSNVMSRIIRGSLFRGFYV